MTESKLLFHIMSTTSRDSIPQLEPLGPSLSPEALDRVSHPTLDPLDEKLTHSGVVRKIMTEKQYGFIQTEDGSDLFFMLNDVQEPWVVAIGDQVTYHVQKDRSHSGKSRAVRVMPSLLARPSCHSPGGSVLRETNVLRSSMVRTTVSARPAAPPAPATPELAAGGRTASEWEAELEWATGKFNKDLTEFAGMDDDEAAAFGAAKVAKSMRADDEGLRAMPKHLRKIVAAKRGLAACAEQQKQQEEQQQEEQQQQLADADALLDRAEDALRRSTAAREEGEGGGDAEGEQQHLEERVVIDPARTAVANRFVEGEEHAGEGAQVVRGKFGFIVAETTASGAAERPERRVLKQKLFFHLQDAPAGTAVGDRVAFVVRADPYNRKKMIAKELRVTRKAAAAGSSSSTTTTTSSSTGTSSTITTTSTAFAVITTHLDKYCTSKAMMELKFLDSVIIEDGKCVETDIKDMGKLAIKMSLLGNRSRRGGGGLVS